ncbi:MAG: acyl-CoA dehydrogenase family protein [Gammaproteobacteria bacterium]
MTWMLNPPLPSCWTFELVAPLGRDEGQELSASEVALLGLLTPLVKATTGKQAAAGLSELIEAFGGAGYIEDTGIPVPLRDGQVLPIWEGTTNVPSLDLLRRPALIGGITALRERCLRAGQSAGESGREPVPETAVKVASSVAASVAAIDAAIGWLSAVTDSAEQQRGARRFMLTLGRALALALLAEHAAILATADQPGSDDANRALSICDRFQRLGINCLGLDRHQQ